MCQPHLRRQIVPDAPDPRGRDERQDLLARHEAAERPRHADVLVYAETEERTV